MGNCNHQQCQFSIENIKNFNDFEETLINLMILKWPLKISMVLKRPLNFFNGFGGQYHHWMFFGTLTIANNGFSMVFGSPNYWFQWFSMVKGHWSNDGMVSMDCPGLECRYQSLRFTEYCRPRCWNISRLLGGSFTKQGFSYKRL